MSWSRTGLGRWFAVWLVTTSLSGCFHPLYSGGANGSVARELAAIDVAPIPDRLGYYLANELTFAFRGGGEALPSKYRLTVTLHERVQAPLVDTVSGRATAATVGVDAEYKLVALGTSDIVASGTAFVAEAYDRSNQRFANIRAARDAEIRGAKSLADQIRTRVSASFKSAE